VAERLGDRGSGKEGLAVLGISEKGVDLPRIEARDAVGAPEKRGRRRLGKTAVEECRDVEVPA
jgi:hypothetical protein